MISVKKELQLKKRLASWITNFGSKKYNYVVYHFRKSFFIHLKSGCYLIHITADNRYRLFVNGQAICSGPARSNFENWYFESIDISPYLHQGNNTIAAVVWDMGDLAPIAQISNQTGFLLKGDTSDQDIVNTNNTWKVMQNQSYQPCSTHNMERLQAYMVVGPGDYVDGSLYPWGWELPDFDDTEWLNAEVVCNADFTGDNSEGLWKLTPRNIPLLREHLIRFSKIRRSAGVSVNPDFLKGSKALNISANNSVSILIDQTYNIVAYPEIIVSGGAGAQIILTYAESLFDDYGNKGNRNDINGKFIMGNYDIFLPDGGENRLFRPLWLRAYRYVQLDITTQSEPLVINDFYSMKTGYPLEMNASFSSNDLSLEHIWNVGWRTAQNCAGEAYYDTPYYEQLQYVGDSRIQALISLYVAGDDCLMRKCLLDFFHSRTDEGLTQSRYPSRKLQVIPAFSLFWISMIHDYWMHRKDDDFVKSFLPAITDILLWFENRIDNTKGMLGPLTWWNFVDWDNFNPRGSAPGAEDGNSSIVSLQYVYTLNQAAELFDAFNDHKQAEIYRDIAKEISKHTYFHCFDEDRGLMADTPDLSSYSQHAGIWTVLSDTVNIAQAKELLTVLLNDQSIGQVTYFYRFYLTQALKKAGVADLYYGMLTPWRDMLKMGLTTFAEKPEPTRSDCHAWSASPNYDFLATICGIMPAAPGFEKVLIKPALAELVHVNGRMPHPFGEISVSFQRIGNDGLKAEISLPQQLTGTLVWKDRSHNLLGGLQYFTL